MEFSFVLVVSTLLISSVINNVNSSKRMSLGHFKLTKLEMCDQSVDYPLKVECKIKDDGDKQLMSGSAEFKVNLGENSDLNLTVSVKKNRDATEFTPLLAIYEEDTCAAMKKYLGDFLNDMEKAAGIEPGQCPIKKGSYSLTDYLLDFKKIAYQSVPEGIYRATEIIRNKDTKEILWCVIAEGENFA